MAGLLQQQPQQQAKAPGSEMVDMEQAKAGMASAMDRVKRIVLAGQTVLYDERTSGGFLKYLDEQNIPESVAIVSSMVMAALIDRGREQAVPPDLVIPAGALIANDLLDYACRLFEVEKTEEMTQQTIKAFAQSMQQGVTQGQQQPQQQPQQGAMQ